MGVLPLFTFGILLATCFVIGCNARVLVLQVKIEPVQPTPTEKDGAPTSVQGNLANGKRIVKQDNKVGIIKTALGTWHLLSQLNSAIMSSISLSRRCS